MAEHALSKLTSENWLETADEIMSVEFTTDAEVSHLAYMVSFWTSCYSATASDPTHHSACKQFGVPAAVPVLCHSLRVYHVTECVSCRR